MTLLGKLHIYIFQTEHGSERAFLILLKNKETTKRKIIKKFIKSNTEIDLKSHLLTVESKIDDILELLFKKKCVTEDKPSNKPKKKRWKSGFEPESEPRQGYMLISCLGR